MKEKTKSMLEILRDIRDKQSKKYFNNPSLLKDDLKKIRRKYHLKTKNKDRISSV
jgi:hypothetical protein